jgi:protein-disulfide isomerase
MATRKHLDKQRPWVIATIAVGALLLVSLLVNAILLTVLMLDGSTATPTPTQTLPPQQAPQQQVEVGLGESPRQGSLDAPVVLIEFSDYTCPFCQRFHEQTLPVLKERYIDTGRLLHVYRDWPRDSLQGLATQTHLAGRCVQELAGDAAYFEWKSLAFPNQPNYNNQNFRTWATQVGVNGQEFDNCVADPQGVMLAKVREDLEAGRAAGVGGTPTFFLNGQRIVGAQPTEVFVQAIEAALS